MYADESSPNLDPDYRPAQTPPQPTARRASIVDRVRVSLFDILGSEARRPVRNHWRGITRDHQQHHDTLVDDDDDVVVVEEQPAQPTSLAIRAFVARNRRLLPIAALVALLLLAFPFLLLIEGIAHSRGPYFHRAARAPAWVSIRDTCSSAFSSIPIPPISVPLPHLPVRPALSAVQTGLSNVWSALKVALRFLFRGAWSSPVRRGELVSTEELEGRIITNVMSAAKAAAAEEAARVTRELGPRPGSGRAAENFNNFAEWYAADKGLPADYALLSVGGGVAASEPTAPWMYARFVRQYVEALVAQERYTPLVPNRPRMALTPDVMPGNCWAFPGEKGSLTIRLARPVRPTSVTIEHTPKRSVFSTLSAPRRFRVYGVPLNASRAAVGRGEMVDLGEFVFDMSDERRHLQSFVLKGGADVAEMRAVKVEILSNHGAPHTSLYRVRVHGTEVEKFPL